MDISCGQGAGVLRMARARWNAPRRRMCVRVGLHGAKVRVVVRLAAEDVSQLGRGEEAVAGLACVRSHSVPRDVPGGLKVNLVLGAIVAVPVNCLKPPNQFQY